MMVGEEKPGIGGDFLLGQKLRTKNSVIPRGAGSDLPAWVAFDRQVLCFDGYFQEAVNEKREEQFRIRKCKVYFYLEDDSIQVIEPRMKNAGVPQGTLIRRHRIPRPPPHDDEFYTVEDFNVDKEVTLYSRSLKLTDCDEFTANFLKKLGVRVTRPSDIPGDPYMSHRKAMDESMQPMRPYEKHDTLKQFLDHDRHVLRFYCYWDDTDNMFGDPREMVLHYFLADDTIEIREMIPANSGRDAAPMFLNRALLPKNVVPLTQPGEKTDRTVLNVFGPTGHGGRYILDSLKTGAVHTDFYGESDLMVGAVINVWGRKFTITDCDDFTKEYFITKYGVDDFTPIKYKADGASSAARQMPPYNGFGSEEDSLCSCMGLIPKPPKRDFIKFMEKDRHGLDSNVLRFLARMDTTKPIDMDRRFIISYFLSDDTILVFEPPVRNSGIIGGKFLERGRVKKPQQLLYSTQLSEYYMSSDLWVGNTVEFNNHKFILIDADEYAFRCMEDSTNEFPVANLKLIMDKLYQNVQTRKDEFNRPEASGDCMPFDTFCQILQSMAGGALKAHEVMTVARYFQDRKDDGVDMETLIAVAQEQLRKANFENFSKVADHCIHYDKDRSGLLDMEAVRSICQALKVPIPDDMIKNMLSKLPTNEKQEVSYQDFVQCLNWRDHPVAPLPAQTARMDDNWTGNKTGTTIQHINFNALLGDLFGR